MSTYRILVPAGIGDFSWLWSRLSTTKDSFVVEYASASPNRLSPYLALLPKDRILGYAMSQTHRCFFNVRTLEMTFNPANAHRITRYSDLREDVLNHVEPNTHLERGGRIERWLPDIPRTDFHYKMEGILDNPSKSNSFVVHLSSTHTFKIWKHYTISTWVDIIEHIQKLTGWTPIFIGGDYDDFAKETYIAYHANHQSWHMTNAIGATPDLLSALHIVQRSRFFMGAVSSGMTMLANVMKIPSVSWWPRELLPQSWNAPAVPYMWRMWKDPNEDKAAIEQWLTTL